LRKITFFCTFSVFVLLQNYYAGSPGGGVPQCPMAGDANASTLTLKIQNYVMKYTLHKFYSKEDYWQCQIWTCLAVQTQCITSAEPECHCSSLRTNTFSAAVFHSRAFSSCVFHLCYLVPCYPFQRLTRCA